MVTYSTGGNLLDADVDALVNSVNTVGVMGKGVALQFRRAFPANYRAYVAACRRGEVELGKMFVWETGRMRPRLIINFPTKAHWRAKSRLDAIEKGLADLRRVLIQRDVESVALPPLGCGLGGLRWGDVRPRIEAALGDLPIPVLVFPPHGAPEPATMPDQTRRPKMTPGRAALVGLLARYLEPGERATPLEVQKLLYFLQAAGEPLKLAFVKQRYGPYADAVRHLVRQLEGHYVIGFGDGTGQGAITLLPGVRDEAERFLADQSETHERFERVARLIEGFETPYGLELLATTHWAAAQEGADSPEEAAERVQSWSERKDRLFTAEHVAVAWERLADGGWIARSREPVRL
jgi:O-acetyl-ADP-ribose deacetylase (regulator of RNase III)